MGLGGRKCLVGLIGVLLACSLSEGWATLTRRSLGSLERTNHLSVSTLSFLILEIKYRVGWTVDGRGSR